MSGDSQTASARLACSWLISYPDETLLQQLDLIANAVSELPDATRVPLETFLRHVADTPFTQIQQHYVTLFDMRRKACPFLSYWTAGDTRKRGLAILQFKQAYADAGFDITDDELPDHLAVVLEFAAVGDPITGDALLAEHAAAIGLLRDSLQKWDSVYVHVLDAVLATLPKVTPEIQRRMAQIAASGPPVEEVGLAPFSTTSDLLTIGARR
jgi:nitrate reductase delta subunit